MSNLRIAVTKLTASENRFTTVEDLLNLLPAHLQVSSESSERYIVFGHETPGPEDRTSPWFRFSQTGDYLGVHIYISGGWRLAVNLPIGAVIEVHNVNLDNLPYGFVVCDGNNESVDKTADFIPEYQGGVRFYSTAFLEWKGLTK